MIENGSSNRLQQLASERYQEWVKNELPRYPNQADFVTQDPAGKPVLDKAAFEAAKANYQSKRAEFEKEFAPTLDPRQQPQPHPVSSLEAASYRTARNRYVDFSNENAMKTGVAAVSYNAKPQQGRSTAGNSPDPAMSLDPTKDHKLLTPVAAAGATQVRATVDPAYITDMLKEVQDPGYLSPQ
jgi:hypothetical protein